MNDAALLRRELRAAREELVRKRVDCSDEPGSPSGPLPLMPDRDEAYLRLALMAVEALEAHVDRLERDLDDLHGGFDRVDEGIDPPSGNDNQPDDSTDQPDGDFGRSDADIDRPDG